MQGAEFAVNGVLADFDKKRGLQTVSGLVDRPLVEIRSSFSFGLNPAANLDFSKVKLHNAWGST